MTTPGNINDAAINAIFDAVVSLALQSGRFDSVNQHEPKSAPGTGITCSIWMQQIRPVPRASGLAATTGLLILYERLYTSFLSQPYDMIDPAVTSATVDLIGRMSADFDFGEIASVRNVDLLGQTGHSLSAQAGYVEIDRRMYRIMTITIPIIVNDMFAQGD